VKIKRLMQTFSREMLDFRPLLNENSQIHDEFKYNASVHAIRARLPFLPVATFTFAVWLSGLIAGILLLLALSPFAFRGNRPLRLLALPLALIVGVFNSGLHIASSLYFHRWMPGVYSSPFLLAAALFLLYAARHAENRSATLPGKV
jgi:hypothetical protein